MAVADLVEAGCLDLDATDRRLVAMADRVLGWLCSEQRAAVLTVRGRVRRCATQEGLAVASAARLGMAADPRVPDVAERLVTWQWPDGGWNCDRRPEAAHSSFHETLGPLRGLAGYVAATADGAAGRAGDSAARFLLDHRLFRSHRQGHVIHHEWLHLHWPPYWHYDVLQGLRAVGAAGALPSPDAAEALDHLESRRRPDGRWRVSGRRHWRRPGATGSGVEVVDWSAVAGDVVTAQAQDVLHLAGRR